MDKFLANIFKEYTSPSVGIKHSAGVYDVKARAHLHVKYDGYPYRRIFHPRQGMTFLGKAEARLSGMRSSLDGFNAKVVTTEGTINIDAIVSLVRSESGLQSNVWSAHIANVQTWDWTDCQTTLLLNGMRYVVLKYIEENSATGDLTGDLGEYDDGHVVIDRNAIAFDEKYPKAEGVKLGWPGANDGSNYPEYGYTNEYLIPVESDVINLRGLSSRDALFMLAMAAAWKRKSRYRVDYDTPKLTDSLCYRHNTDLTSLINDWLEPEPGNAAKVPTPPTAAQAWNAIHKYVAVNRLYQTYSTAMTVLSQAMQQVLPDTAEGCAWLMQTANLDVPKFKASRGWYEFLVHDEAALVGERALREWRYVGRDIGKVFLYSAVLAQAYGSGFAKRSMRYAHEDNPVDLLNSEGTLALVETSFAGYVSEALGVEVPLNNFPQVGVTFAEGMDIGVDIDIPVKEVLDGEGYRLVKDNKYINTKRLPEPGWPILLTPLHIGGENSPYSCNMTLSFPKSKKTRRGCATDISTAWSFAWLARMCGYDTELRRMEFEGPQRFFASNQTQWTHCLTPTEEERGMEVVITGMRQRENHFIHLPPFHTLRYNGEVNAKLDLYNYTFVSPLGEDSLVVESVATGNVGVEGISVSLSAATEYLKGYVKRVPAGFRFVSDVQAGVIGTAQE